KWLTAIELTRRDDEDSFWVDRGWAQDGPIKTQARVDVPASGATVAAGSATIAGVAWAPRQGLSRVGAAGDGGPWNEATPGAAADLAGGRRRLDGVDHVIHLSVRGDRLDPDLGHEVDLVLGAPVRLGVATLAAEAAGLAGRDAGDAGLLQSTLHAVELERLDD